MYCARASGSRASRLWLPRWATTVGYWLYRQDWYALYILSTDCNFYIRKRRRLGSPLWLQLIDLQARQDGYLACTYYTGLVTRKSWVIFQNYAINSKDWKEKKRKKLVRLFWVTHVLKIVKCCLESWHKAPKSVMLHTIKFVISVMICRSVVGACELKHLQCCNYVLSKEKILMSNFVNLWRHPAHIHNSLAHTSRSVRISGIP